MYLCWFTITIFNRNASFWVRCYPIFIPRFPLCIFFNPPLLESIYPRPKMYKSNLLVNLYFRNCYKLPHSIILILSTVLPVTCDRLISAGLHLISAQTNTMLGARSLVYKENPVQMNKSQAKAPNNVMKYKHVSPNSLKVIQIIPIMHGFVYAHEPGKYT